MDMKTPLLAKITCPLKTSETSIHLGIWDWGFQRIDKSTSRPCQKGNKYHWDRTIDRQEISLYRGQLGYVFLSPPHHHLRKVPI